MKARDMRTTRPASWWHVPCPGTAQARSARRLNRATDNQGAESMEGIMGVLAVAGGFGLALGLTMLGMNAVLSIMPSRRRAEAPTVAQAE